MVKKNIGCHNMTMLCPNLCYNRASSSNFGKRPPAKIGKKIIDLTSKLGEINDIEHNKGSKLYPQNQVILDCIMSSIPLKHKCYHSDIGHCFSEFFSSFLNWENQTWYWDKRWLFSIGNGAEIRPLEMGRNPLKFVL